MEKRLARTEALFQRQAMNCLRHLFHRHVLKSFSQEMQDRWCIDSVHQGKKGGFFVEFGAYDGITYSNTYLLEKQYQWSGVCIEPSPRSFKLLQKKRSCTVVNCGVGRQEGILELNEAEMHSALSSASQGSSGVKVPIRPLDDILKDAAAPKVIDFMSVDVEGFEDEALLGFPFEKWSVLSLCIERPSEQLRTLLASRGFKVAGEVKGLDVFFVNEALGHEAPFALKQWSPLQFRVHGIIHRLESWGLISKS